MGDRFGRKNAITDARRARTMMLAVPPGSSAGGSDADTVDGFHATGTPTVSTLLALDANGDFPITTLDGYVQGSIYRGGAADWEVYDASTDAFILVGDGTDIVSVAVSGDAVLANDGTMTIDHDGLTNYVANDHIDHSGVLLTAGAGLTGGGTITLNRTFNVGAGTGIAVNVDDVQLSHLGLEALGDPGADRVLFWDDSETALGWLAMGNGPSITATTLNVDHDATDNYVANDHIDHSGVLLTAGAGLTGGGTITLNRTFNVGAGTGIAVNVDDVQLSHLGLEDLGDPGADRVLFWDDSETALGWLAMGNGPSITATTLNVDHDATDNYVANDHIDHSGVLLTAGSGLTGGGTITLNRTFNVGAGDGITVNANDVALTLPGSLSQSSGNVAAGNHTHAITNTNDGRGNPNTILASSAAGAITMSDYFTDNGGTFGIAGNELFVFDAAGLITISGAKLDLNNNDLILDANGDTFLHVSGDDVAQLVLATASGQFDININGADDFSFVANEFQVPVGSAITMANGTTIGQVAGPLLTFDDAGNDLQISGCEVLIDPGAGLAAPDGTLHVFTASAGAVTANADADEGVFENNASGGISILTPDASIGQIMFSSPGDSSGSRLKWQFSALLLELATLTANAELELRSGNNVQAVRIDSSQNVGIGTTAPDYKLDVAGAVGINDYIYHNGDPDTYTRLETDRWRLFSGGIQMIDAFETGTDYLNLHAGLVGINETANGEMTIGLTIDQAANDDEALNVRSSDVGAVFSNLVDTGTYLTIGKVQGGSGGAMIRGFKDSGGRNSEALVLVGYLEEDVDTSKTTTAKGIVDINGFQTTGTTVENTVANGNILTLRTERGGGFTTVAIWDEDGDYYYDGALVNYDDENDALAAWDLSHVLAGEWNKIIEYGADKLEAMGVIGPDDGNGRRMVSNKRMNALQLGAIGQGYFDRQDLWAEVQSLRERCQRYELALSNAGLLPA